MPKKTVLRLLEKMGYEVLPTWRYERYAQSEYLKKLFEFLQIDCVFDVGANDGQFAQFLRKEVEYDGLIISFEPIPESVEKLKIASGTDGRWVIRPHALGSSKGTLQFNVMEGSQFSSFLEPSQESVNMFADSNRISRKIDVEVLTLAEIMPALIDEFGIKAPYLKLDTQGYDLEVAHGAGSLISDFRALQSEASVKPIYKNMPNYSDTIATYNGMGFELSGIFPNNPEHFPLMIEFDVHMINGHFLR